MLNQLRRLCLAFAAAVLFGTAAAPQLFAQADSIIYPGIQGKLAGGAGETVSRGPTALFVNPANLIFSKFIEIDFDLSFANVTYTYAHVNTDKYDPVVVTQNAPPVTFGLGIRPTPDFALGIAVLPLGLGAVQSIDNVPLGIQGSFQIMNIKQAQTAYKIAGGAALRLSDALTLGLGAIYGSEKDQLQATPDGAQDPFIDALYAGTALQFILGVRSELLDRALVLAFSYKSAATIKYQGNILINLDKTSDYQPFTGVGYDPAVIGLGIEGRFGDFGAFFDLQQQKWAAGATIAKKGLGSDGDAIAYQDVNQITLGGKVWIAKKHMLTASYTNIGANVGDGTQVGAAAPPPDPAGGTGVVTGVEYGDLAAIPRSIFAGGYRYKLSGSGYVELGASYQTGSRAVADGYAQPGLYSIKVIMGSFGVAYGF